MNDHAKRWRILLIGVFVKIIKCYCIKMVEVERLSQFLSQFDHENDEHDDESEKSCSSFCFTRDHV